MPAKTHPMKYYVPLEDRDALYEFIDAYAEKYGITTKPLTGVINHLIHRANEQDDLGVYFPSAEDDQQDNTLFAKNIRYLLKIAGFTQNDFVELTGVSAGAVSSWVNGYTRPDGERIPAKNARLKLEKTLCLYENMDTGQKLTYNDLLNENLVKLRIRYLG